MAGIRRGHLSGSRMIVAPAPPPPPGGPAASPMAPGNESMTAPSVLSLVVRDGMLQRLQDTEADRVEGWSVRVFESASPVVSTEDDNEYADGPLQREPAYGYHYTVAAAAEPGSPLASLPVEQWSNALVVVQDRLRWLYSQKRVAYVAVYADRGPAGGADAHAHLEMVTLPFVPPAIEAEAAEAARVFNEQGSCPLCRMVAAESGGPRQVLETDGFVAVCPWASSRPHEFWVCPKRHSTSFARATQKEVGDLAMMLRSTLGGLESLLGGAPYGLSFVLSPEKKSSKQVHWHARVRPSAGPERGLEAGYGVCLNPVAPEDAAERLGALCRRELASLVGIERRFICRPRGRAGVSAERYVAAAGLGLFAMFSAEMATLYSYMQAPPPSPELALEPGPKLLQFVSIGIAPASVMSGVAYLMSRRRGSRAAGALVCAGAAALAAGMAHAAGLAGTVDPAYASGAVAAAPYACAAASPAVAAFGALLMRPRPATRRRRPGGAGGGHAEA